MGRGAGLLGGASSKLFIADMVSMLHLITWDLVMSMDLTLEGFFFLHYNGMVMVGSEMVDLDFSRSFIFFSLNECGCWNKNTKYE
jgi:hypothetical protein